eukprot:COSAG03_NODE_400_length_8206_cov_3.320340_4_plen_83_part_00
MWLVPILPISHVCFCNIRSIKPSERLRTPTYEIDTYRPYTHRATGVSKRSELFDNRFRDTRAFRASRLFLGFVHALRVRHFD